MLTIVFVIVLVFFSSCERGVEVSELSGLRMVISLSEEGIDTLGLETDGFSLREGLGAYSFYEEDLLIRNFQVETEFSYGDTTIGNVLLKRQKLLDTQGDLVTCAIWENGTPWTVLYDDYILIENYPFQGINCFER